MAVASSKTSYRLLNGEAEEEACWLMAERFGVEFRGLDFPTVVAKRSGVIVGFLATHPEKTAVVAGPLIVDLPVRAWVALRLVEAYENVLRMAGVESYLFHVDETNKLWYNSVVKALSIAPYAEADGVVWFKRDLGDDSNSKRAEKTNRV